MAVKDGLPATDFSRMNREYIKAVAEGGSGGGGGSGEFYIINENQSTHALDKTFIEIYNAYIAGKVCAKKLFWETAEGHGDYWSFEYIVEITRYTDEQGEGAGGNISTLMRSYSAQADTDYPIVVM